MLVYECNHKIFLLCERLANLYRCFDVKYKRYKKMKIATTDYYEVYVRSGC